MPNFKHEFYALFTGNSSYVSNDTYLKLINKEHYKFNISVSSETYDIQKINYEFLLDRLHKDFHYHYMAISGLILIRSLSPVSDTSLSFNTIGDFIILCHRYMMNIISDAIEILKVPSKETSKEMLINGYLRYMETGKYFEYFYIIENTLNLFYDIISNGFKRETFPDIKRLIDNLMIYKTLDILFHDDKLNKRKYVKAFYNNKERALLFDSNKKILYNLYTFWVSEMTECVLDTTNEDVIEDKYKIDFGEISSSISLKFISTKLESLFEKLINNFDSPCLSFIFASNNEPKCEMKEKPNTQPKNNEEKEMKTDASTSETKNRNVTVFGVTFNIDDVEKTGLISPTNDRRYVNILLKTGCELSFDISPKNVSNALDEYIETLIFVINEVDRRKLEEEKAKEKANAKSAKEKSLEMLLEKFKEKAERISKDYIICESEDRKEPEDNSHDKCCGKCGTHKPRTIVLDIDTVTPEKFAGVICKISDLLF